MKALVTYYTRTGSTKKVAESICSSLNCDIEEIVDLKNRKGIFGFISSGYAAYRKKLTEIKAPEQDASAYDLVIIGTPVWAGAMVPAVRTYLTQLKSKNALADRKVAFFCTMAGTDGEKVLSSLASLAGNESAASMALATKEITEGFDAKLKGFISRASA